MRLSLDSKLAYITLFFCVALYSLHIWLSQPPTVVKVNAPVETFSAERALVVLKDLLQQEQPHPVGSAANQFVRSRIEHRLDELGISYNIQTTWACRYQSNRCAEIENVIATIPGNSDQKSIVLMAHYDSVPTSTGAGDDAAAVAAILESARALVLEAPLPRPVVLLFTDGEETGLLGAEAFFQDEALIERIGIVLNYEGSGSKGVSRVLRTSPRGTGLIDLYKQSANPATGNSLSNEVFKRMPNDTDFSTVIRAGLHGIDFAFAEERNHYHTQNDSIANLDLRTLQHHGNNMLPLVRAALSMDVITESEPLVYTDPYGLWLQWPASWQPIFILIATLMLIAAIRLHYLNAKVFAINTGISILVLISSIVSGLAAFKLVEWLLGPLPGWPAQLSSFRLVLFAAPSLGGLAVIWLFRRWSAPLPLFLCSTLWLLLMSACLTVFMPDAANIFILGLLPASLTLLLSGLVKTELKMPVNLVAMVALVPATLSLIHPIEASQGYSWVVTIIPSIALFTMLVAPFLMSMARPLTLLFLISTSIGVIWSVNEPLYSQHRPQAINFLWYQNQTTGEAYLTVRHQGNLPDSLEGHFSSSPAKLVPFIDQPMSKWLELPDQIDGGAGVEIISRTDSSLSLRLHTRKNVAAIRLYLPSMAGLSSYQIDGVSFKARAGRASYDLIELTGLFGKQVGLNLEFSGDLSGTAYLANVFYPLPKVLDPFQTARSPLGTSVHQGDQAVSFRPINL